jgi:sterol desaturase/sphingolipid hydroxylase (fatty acid hydroxylase superfamily)
MGQWNHLLTLYILTRFLNVHVLAVLFFIAVGGFFASLNHTRLDSTFFTLVLSQHALVDWLGFWAVVNHDTHHWFPTSNYGQYIVFWDHIFGTYKTGHAGI